MALNAEFRDVDDLVFKFLNQISITPAVPHTFLANPTNLLAVSHNYGLLFVSVENGFKIILTEAVENLGQGKPNDVPFADVPVHLFVPLDVTPHHIFINNNSIYLAVCCFIADHGEVCYVYEVESLLKNLMNPISQIRLSSDPLFRLVDFSWNPGETFSDIFASCLSTGSIAVWKIDSRSVSQIAKSPDKVGSCVSWSPRGKQIAVGCLDGSLIQLDHRLVIKRRTTITGIASNLVGILKIFWVLPTNFLVCFKTDGQPTLLNVTQQKSGNPIVQTLEDVCFGSNTNLTKDYYFQNIPNWELMLVGSKSSNEIAVLGRAEKHKHLFEIWTLDDEMRATIPYNLADKTSSSESYATGLVIDLTSQTEICLPRRKKLSRVPVLFVLTSKNVLLSFYIANYFENIPDIMIKNKARLSDISKKTSSLTPQNILSSQTLSSAQVRDPVEQKLPVTKSSITPSKLEGSSMKTDTLSGNKEKQSVSPVVVQEEVPGVDLSKIFKNQIKNEFINFEQEMYNIRQLFLGFENLRISQLGDKEDMKKLIIRVEKLDRFVADVKNTTLIHGKEISELKNNLLEGFAAVDVNNSVLLRNRQPQYLELLRSRPLDAPTQKTLSKITSLATVLDSRLTDLDDESGDILSRISKKSRVTTSNLVSQCSMIYKVISNNYNLIVGQQDKIRQIDQEMRKLRFNNLSLVESPDKENRLKKVANAGDESSAQSLSTVNVSVAESKSPLNDRGLKIEPKLLTMAEQKTGLSSTQSAEGDSKDDLQIHTLIKTDKKLSVNKQSVLGSMLNKLDDPKNDIPKCFPNDIQTSSAPESTFQKKYLLRQQQQLPSAFSQVSTTTPSSLLNQLSTGSAPFTPASSQSTKFSIVAQSQRDNSKNNIASSLSLHTTSTSDKPLNAAQSLFQNAAHIESKGTNNLELTKYNISRCSNNNSSVYGHSLQAISPITTPNTTVVTSVNAILFDRRPYSSTSTSSNHKISAPNAAVSSVNVSKGVQQPVLVSTVPKPSPTETKISLTKSNKSKVCNAASASTFSFLSAITPLNQSTSSSLTTTPLFGNLKSSAGNGYTKNDTGSSIVAKNLFGNTSTSVVDDNTSNTESNRATVRELFSDTKNNTPVPITSTDNLSIMSTASATSISGNTNSDSLLTEVNTTASAKNPASVASDLFGGLGRKPDPTNAEKNPFGSVTPSTGGSSGFAFGSVFSNVAKDNSPLSASSAAPKVNLFGTSNTLFSTTATTTTSTGTGLFGISSAGTQSASIHGTGNGLFGSAVQNSISQQNTTTNSGSFGSISNVKVNVAQGGFGFGGNSSSGSSLFGGASASKPSFGGPAAFGGAPFFGGASAFGASSPLFGGTSTFGTSSLGNTATGSRIFGASSTSNKPTTGGFAGLREPYFSGFAGANSASFGSLAQQQTPSSGGFGGLSTQPSTGFGALSAKSSLTPNESTEFKGSQFTAFRG